VSTSVVPRLDAGSQVWWASASLARPAHLALLDHHEVARHARLRRQEDRSRLVVGAALARLVVGEHLGRAPDFVRLDRTCGGCGEPHGKPKVLEADGLEISVSHSGERVAVAVSRAYAVGVDVEQTNADLDVTALAEQVLTTQEWEDLTVSPTAVRVTGFFRYWSRKEAIVKATGDGLREPLRNLTVSKPVEEPALERWHGRPDVPARVRLVDLRPGPGYVASLAELRGTAPRGAGQDVVELDALDLLTEAC
jgi:4'-phosphopantetheinyl transferase